jgi:preprotein translocase subunit SecG
MVQNPKGGGLSSTLGGSTQMGGVQKQLTFRQEYVDISYNFNSTYFTVKFKLTGTLSDSTQNH